MGENIHNWPRSQKFSRGSSECNQIAYFHLNRIAFDLYFSSCYLPQAEICWRVMGPAHSVLRKPLEAAFAMYSSGLRGLACRRGGASSTGGTGCRSPCGTRRRRTMSCGTGPPGSLRRSRRLRCCCWGPCRSSGTRYTYRFNSSWSRAHAHLWGGGLLHFNLRWLGGR